MTNRVGRQHATKSRALPPETSGRLGGQTPICRVGSLGGQHLPAHHGAVAVFGNPELKDIVL